MISVTVYSTGPRCMRCGLTCRRLDEAGIPFTVIDLTRQENASQREFVTDELGYTEAPVVVVDDEPENHWSGFRPDLIDRLAAHIAAPATNARVTTPRPRQIHDGSAPTATLSDGPSAAITDNAPGRN